jgi:hypothetical protein
MASILKLDMDELDEVHYHLIAIHTNLEDYHLAYHINKRLPTLLKKNPIDLHVIHKNQDTCYTRFYFEDEKELISWDLLENKNSNSQSISLKDSDLFSQSEIAIATTNYLLPEFKKVNYFLKITNERRENKITEFISKINSIDKINLVYCVNAETIKNKNNLIF